jgi:3-oxoacyl-(acyl-carrier-protein) synthase
LEHAKKRVNEAIVLGYSVESDGFRRSVPIRATKGAFHSSGIVAHVRFLAARALWNPVAVAQAGFLASGATKPTCVTSRQFHKSVSLQRVQLKRLV